jgi:hypothetical protein
MNHCPIKSLIFILRNDEKLLEENALDKIVKNFNKPEVFGVAIGFVRTNLNNKNDIKEELKIEKANKNILYKPNHSYKNIKRDNLFGVTPKDRKQL